MFDSIREFYDELLLNWSIIQQAMAPLRLTRWQMFKLFAAEIHRDNPLVVKLVVLSISLFWLSVIANVLRPQETGSSVIFSLLGRYIGVKRINTGDERQKSLSKVRFSGEVPTQSLLFGNSNACRVLTYLRLSELENTISKSSLPALSMKSSASQRRKHQDKTTSAPSHMDTLAMRQMRC